MTTQVPYSLINLSDTGLFTLRNTVINGNFDVWQRGTTGTISISASSAIGYPSADKWKVNHIVGAGSTGTVAIVGSQQLFTPGQGIVPGEPAYYFRTQASSLATLAGTGAVISCETYVENARTFAGQNATISFWAKADSSRTCGLLSRRAYGTGGSPSGNEIVFQTTFNVTTTFQFFTFSFPMTSISGKTFGTAANSSLLTLDFILYKQDNIQYGDTLGPLGSYSTTPFLDLSQVQYEKGLVTTPFEFRPIALETELCQRYFEKIGGQSQYDIIYQGYSTTAAPVSVMFPLKVVKRIPVLPVKVGTWFVSNCGQPAIVGVSSDTFVVMNAGVTATGIAQFNTVDTTTYVTASADF